MNINWNEVKIFIQPGITDMYKQINGLAIAEEEELKEDPMNGHFSMFCKKDRKRLKILYWDRNGFCMLQKRLNHDRFS